MIAFGRSSAARTGAALLVLVGAAVAHSAPAPAPAGIDLAGTDRTVAPGDDFFAYANGTWLKTTEIPGDRGSYGVFGILFDRTNEQTAALIAETAKAPAGTPARKIGDFYESFLDEAGIEAKGIAPLQPTLDRIGAIADRKALARELGGTLRADVDAINATNFYTDNVLGVWVAKDLDDPTRMVPFLLQGGLDMPDRAYYLDASPEMDETRAAYLTHVAAVLRLVKKDDAAGRAARIFALEHRLATAHGSREDGADVHKGDNHWSRADFDTKAPGLDWTEFLGAAGLGSQPGFVVWQPSAVVGLSALVASEPVETWKDYLAFHAVEHASRVLPKAFVEERFAFHGKVLGGIPQMRERAKRAIDATNDALGEEVGKLYAARYFPPAEKARAEKMVKNITAAFARRIDALSWMAPQTRARAKAKLAVLKVGVGYPDRWRDSSTLEIVRGDAFGNADRVERFEYAQSLKQLGQPADRSLWVMTPQTVNAVNLPALNAMNFPAAILQPPFFDPKRAEVMDYGAIGSVIGHEISHSFDDQGAEFDEEGRLRNWWTDEDKAHFQASAERLVRQYDGYRPFPDVAVNGKLTLSENLADVAGLAATYDAYRLSLGGKPAPAVAGLTGDQQFFLAFAQAWRVKTRDASLRQQILGDGHAPGQYRVATVRNLDAWYAAFDVKPGQALHLAPSDRVRVW